MKNSLFSLIIVTALILCSGFKYTPKKGTIVSLSPYITEIIYELGAEDMIIGVTSWCDYPPDVKNKKQLGYAFQINKEVIIKLKPEYIIALNTHEPLIEDLSILGIKIHYFPSNHLSDVYENIERTGEITGKTVEATNLIEKLKKELETYKAKKKKRILYVLSPEPLMVVGKNSFISELIKKSGHENVMDAVNNKYYGAYPMISYEFAMAQNPDIVLIAHYPEAISYIQGYLPNAEFKLLNHEQGSILIRAGPRINQAVKILSDL